MNHNIDLHTFCENVKKLREINRLSMQAMAKRLRIGAKSLSMIENGEIPPRLSAKIIITICREFKISPGKLFTPP